MYLKNFLAEKEGFEPSHACAPNDLANRPLRPLGYFSKPIIVPCKTAVQAYKV